MYLRYVKQVMAFFRTFFMTEKQLKEERRRKFEKKEKLLAEWLEYYQDKGWVFSFEAWLERREFLK